MPTTDSSTQNRILHEAEELFRMNGYHHTSMDEVAAATGMKKGSLYYHFSGKEELMKAVLEAGRHQFANQILEIAYEEDRPPRERMELLFERVEADYLTIEGGCIMGNIGLETVHTVPAFRPVIRRFFSDWIEAFVTIFEARFDGEEARHRAEQSVEEIEGAIMMCRLFGDPRYIQEAKQRVLDRL